MAAFESIESVAVEPDHCHRCGAELDTIEWEGDDHPWCPECDLLLSRAPVAGTHTIVHDEDSVLLLDEPIPQHEGILSLPGGFAKPHEAPKEAALRELEEETGLTAEERHLDFVTILHGEFPESALYLVTYSLHRSHVHGHVEPEAEGFEAGFHSLDEIQSKPERIRESDLERIEMALES